MIRTSNMTEIAKQIGGAFPPKFAKELGKGLIGQLPEEKDEKKGNMYGWIDKTRNYIGGECPHKCNYCWVNSMKEKFPAINNKYSGPLKLLEDELKKNEGKNKTIFVQDCGDMFAEAVPSEWIIRILNHLKDYPENTYLFQSKNPERFMEFLLLFPPKFILGTTAESDRIYFDTNAPHVNERINAMILLPKEVRKTLTIEPIMDFDLGTFVYWIKSVNFDFVSIGADSKNSGLNEPSAEKVRKLIEELQTFTQVKVKDNLKRILQKK